MTTENNNDACPDDHEHAGTTQPATPAPKKAALAKLQPKLATASFGPPPLFIGESKKAYNAMLARVTATVNPLDIFEEIWVREIVDLQWDITRFRTAKTNLLNNARPKAIVQMLHGLIGNTVSEIQAHNLARAWLARDEEARDEVEELLEEGGLGPYAFNARAVGMKLEDLERMDRMLASMELRRDTALRNIERHRTGLGAMLRQSLQQIEDAEFEIVDAGAPSRKAAA